MNHIIPKCKLKDICELLKIGIKLTSIRSDATARAENFGEKNGDLPLYRIGLVDEHYFIIHETNVTSFCLLNYDDVSQLHNCNMVYRKNKRRKT